MAVTYHQLFQALFSLDCKLIADIYVYSDCIRKLLAMIQADDPHINFILKIDLLTNPQSHSLGTYNKS